MRVDERLELPHEAVAAQRQVGLDALLEGGQAELLQALGLARADRLEHDALERAPAPQRKRFTQALAGPRGIVLQAGLPLGGEGLEAR